MKDLSNETMIQKEKDGIYYLQFRRLLEESDIKHMYVLKNTDLSFKRKDDSWEETENLRRRYEMICSMEEMDGRRVVRTNQNHTDEIKVIEESIFKTGPAIYLQELENTDGVMTNEANIVLSTTNADCLLLLFYDKRNRAIANVHSGWKGTFQKISQKAVKKMESTYGTKPEELLCFMTPCIRACCFEVREDVKKLCEEAFDYTGELNKIITDIGIVKGEQKYTIDNVGINKILLQEAGMKSENIIESHICSMCERDMIHSRRAEGPNYGVGTALICLR